MLVKKILMTVFLVVPAIAMAFGALKNNEEYRYMDDLALAAGADKASSYHNYTRVYSQYFAPLKNEPIKFLEIGVYKGASVNLWEHYFTNADLHFMDIDFSRQEYISQNVSYHNVNQEDAAALDAFRKVEGEFDIILDDGGHTMKQQITSLIYLITAVKSGGMYIIEDLHTSYWKGFGGYGNPLNPLAGPGCTTEFLKALVDCINYPGARTTKANFDLLPPEIYNNLNYWQKNIESIHFYDSICIIIKR